MSFIEEASGKSFKERAALMGEKWRSLPTESTGNQGQSTRDSYTKGKVRCHYEDGKETSV